jgi:hypothetical protein
MRTSRRFSPVFDCMSARIAPSSISLITPVTHVLTSAVAAMDSTGEPTTDPSSSGGNPVIVGTPGGNGSGNC